ncbi:MAG: hypothetical protein NW703_11105 [Nitrospiraceae bacterium]
MTQSVFRLLPLFAFGLIGCTSVQYNQTDCGTLPSDTFWSGNVALQCQEYRRLQAETAYRNEVAKLMQNYRECLQKYEGASAEAKERCSLYTQAFRDPAATARPSR